MIFKYCAWPEEGNQGDKTIVLKNKESNSIERDQNFNEESRDLRKKEYKIANTILRYCPCAFRCRQPVDIEKEEEDSILTIVTTVNTTPVIPLRSNPSNETIDKAVKEEEHNKKNKHYFLPDDHFGGKTLNVAQTQYEVDDQEFSSSENNDHQDSEQDVQNTQDDSDFRSSTPERQNVNTAFNIITGQISPPGRDFIISLDKKIETEIEVTNISIDDDRSKNWNSDEELKFKDQHCTTSRTSEHVEYFEENQNENEVNISDEIEKIDEVISVLANKNLQSDSENEETLISKKSASSQKSNRSPSRNSSNFETSKSSRCDSRNSPYKLNFESEDNDSIDLNKNKAISSTIQRDIIQPEELNQSRRESKSPEESPAIIIASRPHSSTEISNYIENRLEISTQIEVNDNLRFFKESNENNDLENGQNKDSSSETNTDPGILKIETQSVEPGPTTKRKPSKVPRIAIRSRGRSKGNLEKIKPIVQQCFVQLENKDWEIIMKALKTLSQIAKQQPEYLDICAASTINRLVARQIKSLRSQVARTACLAAGDIFSSQIRGIDQEFDDIAGSLLHRTADTNRFLRSDSNAALDRMIEHLPPHKTITVIVQCGASHQNAIVRAATARLLASIVDRIGPEHTLILPKDVRDKLLSTGARLLIDGNLDARNHAKKMFRKLTHCEGFRKALTDAVPETTLRHIDKTLKAL
ncbi:hypothetical protein APICC_05479 [Apis cerana cerana]|uniref:TOG domain-containing protein n=1 Tax=Apis cerana cerana TaxID=94128 RepID=A0A2A3EL92_APICC|nr:hypothetical protein APICC_05479 [Apis cerana cerana]